MMIDAERIWTSPRLPTLPAVAVRLLELSRNPEAGICDFVQLIRSDPATAAKILKAANSSYFGFVDPVSSIDRAVPLLGTTVVTSLALSFSLTQWEARLHGAGDPYRTYWLQSVVQAAAAELLAGDQPRTADCDVFLAALLADIGQLAMLRAVPVEYGPVLEAARSGSRRLDEVEHELLGLTHVDTGVRLGQDWRLPEPIVSAIRLHHAPIERLQNESGSPHFAVIKTVAAATAVGDYYCSSTKAAALERLQALSSRFFEFTPPKLKAYLDQIHRRIDRVGELLSYDTSQLPSPEDLLSEAGEQLAQLTIREHVASTQAAARRQSVEEDNELLKHENSRLQRQTLRDHLTGLYNRQYFDIALAHEIQRGARNGALVGVLCADIDGFKQLNDAHGHPCGDAVLQQVAQTLERMLRGSDVLARYGGEEFLIIANQPTENALWKLAERLRTRVESENFGFGEQRLGVTISIGAALALPSRCESDLATQLIVAADNAMYRAKRAGKNRTEVQSLLSEDERRLLQKANQNRFSRWLAGRGEFDVPVLSRILLERPHERVPIGELAQKRGYLTVAQIERIRENQERTGMRFGEAALVLRVLTEEQLAHLLALQLESPVVVARTLASAGLCTQGRATELLRQYLTETIPTTPALRRAVTVPN